MEIRMEKIIEYSNFLLKYYQNSLFLCSLDFLNNDIEKNGFLNYNLAKQIFKEWVNHRGFHLWQISHEAQEK